ncbi:Diaminohydroxyphosphoribosylaminopyrimidine deaminase / 5-amino-6-(5-phosphoribosylamino)uracil reductase, partial [hydrothermal vent metagenome]
SKHQSKGATLYVSLEPCFHTGRTGPCVDVIVESQIKKVVIGRTDPNKRTNGKSIHKLRRAGISVVSGVLKEEATQINEIFFKYIQTGLPFVATKTAQSLDGKIATCCGDSQWITSKESRNYARKIRNEFDAILIGSQTLLKDNPNLNAQDKNKQIKKIIVDSSLKTPLTAQIFKNTLPQNCLIAVTPKVSLKKKNAFVQKGIQLIVCPQRKDGIDLKYLFKELAKREITSILIEGGAHVIGSSLANKLVDKMYLYLSPKIFGDQSALSSVVGRKIKKVSESIDLKQMSFKKIEEDVLLTGYLK